VIGVSNAAGEAAEKRLYMPFVRTHFEQVTDLTLTPEDKGFIGERYDAHTGLQYLNARYYDPELGLFIQPDWFEVTAVGVVDARGGFA